MPAMKATPSTTASDVSAKRNFLAKSPLTVTFQQAQPPWRLIETETRRAQIKLYCRWCDTGTRPTRPPGACRTVQAENGDFQGEACETLATAADRARRVGDQNTLDAVLSSLAQRVGHRLARRHHVGARRCHERLPGARRAPERLRTAELARRAAGMSESDVIAVALATDARGVTCSGLPGVRVGDRGECAHVVIHLSPSLS